VCGYSNIIVVINWELSNRKSRVIGSPWMKVSTYRVLHCCTNIIMNLNFFLASFRHFVPNEVRYWICPSYSKDQYWKRFYVQCSVELQKREMFTHCHVGKYNLYSSHANTRMWTRL